MASDTLRRVPCGERCEISSTAIVAYAIEHGAEAGCDYDILDNGLLRWRAASNHERLDVITYSPVDGVWQGWDECGRLLWTRPRVRWWDECTMHEVSPVPVPMYPLPVR